MVNWFSNKERLGGILCLLGSNRSLRWLDVCICTDASIVQGTRFWSSSRSIGAGSRALRSIAADAALGDTSSDEDEVSLARWESRADFPEVPLQLLDPEEWKLAAFGGFFREEIIIILDARSILYAVRHAENHYPPERFLILSGNLALVPVLCKRNSMFSHCFQSCVGSLHLA